MWFKEIGCLKVYGVNLGLKFRYIDIKFSRFLWYKSIIV